MALFLIGVTFATCALAAAAGGPRPCSRIGALVLAVRTGSNWRYVGHAGTGFDEEMLRSLSARCSGYPVRRSRFLYSVPRLHQWAVASLTEPQLLKARERARPPIRDAGSGLLEAGHINDILAANYARTPDRLTPRPRRAMRGIAGCRR